jgi:tetratricopeptide (TPR) repeat protein
MNRMRRGFLGTALAVLCAFTAPALAQTEVPALSRDQAEILHRGMLELRTLERQGDRAGAIRRGEALLKEFPASRRVEDALAQLYRLEHQDEPLIELFRRRTQRDGNDLESFRELASLLMQRERDGDAIEVFQKMIAANPRDQNRYRVAASFLRSRGQIEPAIRFYRDGRRAVGQEDLFAAELATLEEERNDLAAALAEYVLLSMDPEQRPRAAREITGLIERSETRTRLLSRVDEMRSRHARSAPVQDIAAMAYLQVGRYADALAAIRDADRLAGDQGEHLLDFGRAALAVGRTGALIDSDRVQIGVQALALLTERHPKSGLVAEATRMSAEGLVSVAREMEPGEPRTRLLQQAVRALEGGGSDLAPHFETEARMLRAMILFEDLGDAAGALPVFETIAAQQRDAGTSDALVRVQVGLCHAALGDFAAARTALSAVAATADSTYDPFGNRRTPPRDLGVSRARYHLAELDVVEGKYQEASAVFAALAEEAPEDRFANDCLDRALVLNEAMMDEPNALQRYAAVVRARLRRDPATARLELEALVRDSARSTLAPVALMELAGLLAREGGVEPALQHYDRVMTDHAEHRLAPRALEAKGDLQLERLHRPDLAQASYERILMEYSDDLFLDAVRKKLLAARDAAKGGAHATP